MERCDKHDMLIGQCADCKPRVALYSFQAQYPGTCATCHEVFPTGEEIMETPLGDYEHARHVVSRINREN